MYNILEIFIFKLCQSLNAEKEQVENKIKEEYNVQITALQNNIKALKESRDTEIEQIYNR